MTESLRCKSPKANFASDMSSVDMEDVRLPNSLSSLSSEHVSSFGIANITIVSLKPKMMQRIMACNITLWTAHKIFYFDKDEEYGRGVEERKGLLQSCYVNC